MKLNKTKNINSLIFMVSNYVNFINIFYICYSIITQSIILMSLHVFI